MQNLYAILGVIFLVFLLVKAWHLWRAYRSTLRLKIEPVPGGDVEVPERNNEIVGPARIVQRNVASHLVNHTESHVDAAPETAKPIKDESYSEAVSHVSSEVLTTHTDSDLALQHSSYEDVVQVSAVETREAEVVVQPAAASVVNTTSERVAPKKAEQADLFAHEVVSLSKETATTQHLNFDTKNVEPVSAWAEPDDSKSGKQVAVEDFIAVHVVARTVPFHGEDLLRSILSYGLRYGEMNIFHRHEMPTGQGAVLFSMAQAVEPGTFDLQNMANDMIPGVTFFLSLPGINRIGAYDIMMDTAKRLATEFNADMLDQNQTLMTRQLLEHYRERVIEFERKRMAERRQ